MSGEAMEVFLKDRLRGEQHAVHIGEDDTPVDLKAKALDVVLGSPADVLPEDVELSVDGEVLDNSTPLCGAAGVSQGCCIDVALSGARFIEALEKQKRDDLVQSGMGGFRSAPRLFSARIQKRRPGVPPNPWGFETFNMSTIPAWARGLRDVALAMVRYDSSGLEHLDDSFRNDKHIVTAAVHSYNAALQHASEDLRADEDLVLLSENPLTRGRTALMHASPSLFSNKPFVINLVQRQGQELERVDAALRADKEVVMAAVQSDGDALQYACESLRNDRQVVMAAGSIRNASAALRNDKEVVLRCMRMGGAEGVAAASEALRGDREVMLTAVRLSGNSFRHASSSLRRQTEFQREVVLWNGTALEYVPYTFSPEVSLREDRDLILAAVETCCTALRYAHPSLQGDREVVLAAMHSRGWGQEDALGCAAEHLKQDEEVVLAGVRRDPVVLNLSLSFRGNKDFVMQCVKLHGCALQYTSCSSVRSDREVQLAAVAQDPSAIEWCDESIRSNRDLVLAAVRKSGDALRHASSNLHKDREVVLAAVKSSDAQRRGGWALQYADVTFHKDEEVVLAATHTSGVALRHADPSFLSNRDFMLAAVRKCGCALRFASASLCRDKELQLAAVLQDGRAMQYADHSLRSDRSVVLQAARG